MANICEKKIKCDKCPHLKYDEDNGEWACFAKQDGAVNEFGVITDDEESEVHS